MNTEQQNLAWACLPKEVRDEVIRCFKYTSKNSKSDLQRDAADTLEHFFGSHNLTSDTEPPEMLMVSKSKVTELYKIGLELLDSSIEKPNNMILRLSRGIRFALKKLFGDKCLPDDDHVCVHACGTSCKYYSQDAPFGCTLSGTCKFEPKDEYLPPRDGVDLKKLGKMLDEALEKETPETIKEFLDSKSGDERTYLVNFDGKSYRIGKGTVIDGENIYGDVTLFVESVKEDHDGELLIECKDHSFKTRNRELIFPNTRILGIKNYYSPKFREGDIVMVIDSIRAIYPDPMTIVGVVKEEDTGVYRYLMRENNKCFHQDNLELYHPEEFLPGDEVLVTGEDEVFKVMSSREGEYELKTEAGFRFGWVKGEYLKRYKYTEEKSMEEEPDFKAGETVKVNIGRPIPGKIVKVIGDHALVFIQDRTKKIPLKDISRVGEEENPGNFKLGVFYGSFWREREIPGEKPRIDSYEFSDYRTMKEAEEVSRKAIQDFIESKK